MEIKSVFIVVHKSTKAFVFLIAAETKEQSKQILNAHLAHLDPDSRLFEIVESTLILSEEVIQIQQLNADPWKEMSQAMEYAEIHPSNY